MSSKRKLSEFVFKNKTAFADSENLSSLENSIDEMASPLKYIKKSPEDEARQNVVETVIDMPDESPETSLAERSVMSDDDTAGVEDQDSSPEKQDVSDEGHDDITTSDDEDTQEQWRGSSIETITPASLVSELPPVVAAANHKVMFQLPTSPGCVPRPEPQTLFDSWIKDHVRMPYSEKSKYPVKEEPSVFRHRWEMIQEAFENRISSTQQLEEAIMSYNHTYGETWDFSLLHYMFEQDLTEEETLMIFGSLLPRVIELALRLPSLVTQPVPLLLRGERCQLSLSQLQIASLLANAFLCTFPRRNSAAQRPQGEYSNFPDINFNRLFHMHKKTPKSSTIGKLKCIFHYFNRVTKETPQGTVTFSRRHMAPKSLPDWGNSNVLLSKLHVTSTGTIEDQGFNMLQVDFANRVVGGGVLGSGCVQEEIRFVICTELIVSRLFTESLDHNEALVITGVERYNNYSGYAQDFEWVGDHKDKTPRDDSGRRQCSMVAIDALPFSRHVDQFHPAKMRRELNKAFVGFSAQESDDQPNMPIATGNWGCGAFQGDKRLKAILQLMAAAQAGRDVAYFTFGDRVLRDELATLHSVLVEQRATVGQMYRALQQYVRDYLWEGRFSCKLYHFLQAKFTPGTRLPPPVHARLARENGAPTTSSFTSVSTHKQKEVRSSSEQHGSSERLDAEGRRKQVQDMLAEEDAEEEAAKKTEPAGSQSKAFGPTLEDFWTERKHVMKAKGREPPTSRETQTHHVAAEKNKQLDSFSFSEEVQLTKEVKTASSAQTSKQDDNFWTARSAGMSIKHTNKAECEINVEDCSSQQNSYAKVVVCEKKESTSISTHIKSETSVDRFESSTKFKSNKESAATTSESSSSKKTGNESSPERKSGSKKDPSLEEYLADYDDPYAGGARSNKITSYFKQAKKP